MKHYLLTYLILVYSVGTCFADVKLQVYVPDYKKPFGIWVKGNNITRLAISVPVCLGHLAFDVRDGYNYRIDTDRNCVMRVTYHKQ